jgi:hypothetical protein
VKVITFPPHTNQILQTLDLCLFDLFKRKIQYQLPFANDNLTVNFIRNAFHALKQTFVPVSPLLWKETERNIDLYLEKGSGLLPDCPYDHSPPATRLSGFWIVER